MEITRRDILSAAGGALAAMAMPAIASSESSKPNVLFIAIDDLNDWIEPLGGYPLVKTPNLRRLAAMCRTFTNAHTAAPACGPARAATVFGMQPHTTGMYTMREKWWSNAAITRQQSLMAAFRARGYDTFGTGKILHGNYADPAMAAEIDGPAWSEFNFCSDCVEPSGPKVERLKSYEYGPAGRLADAPDYRRARWLVDNVLTADRQTPFFAAIGFSKPHLPFIVPKPFFDLYDREKLVYPPGVLDRRGRTFRSNDDVADLPKIAKEMIGRTYDRHLEIWRSGEWLDIVHAYLASISFTDRCVGLLLDAVPQDTIIVLWSDHGWQLGEKLAWQKFTLWERATKIPMMIGGPGIAPGLSDAPVSSIDIYPTLMDLVFGERPAHLDGRSLRKHLLQGKSPAKHVMTTWMLNDARPEIDGPHFSIRTRKHRFIAYRNGEIELYDHRVDPFEWDNIADDAKPAFIEALRRLAPDAEACAPRSG